MLKFLLPAAAVSAATIAAAPAAAQYYEPAYGGYQQQYNNPYQDNGYDRGYRNSANAGRWSQQLGQLDNDIARLAQQGRLTGREVRQLRHDIRVVDNALRQYSRTGINQRRAYDLDRRVRNLRIAIGRSANDADTRYNNRYR